MSHVKLGDMKDFLGLKPSQITEIGRQLEVSCQIMAESNDQFARRVLAEAAAAGRLQDLLDRLEICRVVNRG